MSTLSLQAVANANRRRKTVQVLGLVADPAVAAVGISCEDPFYGSFLPMQDAFAIAREMFPELKRVGVAWNPAEANSRAPCGRRATTRRWLALGVNQDT